MQDEVNELYRVFHSYRIGPDFSGCEHCVDPVESEQLATAELRSLSLGDLGKYAFKAMTTWGDVCDFKHFLPRLFELVAHEDTDQFELEVLFRKLDYAGWYDWPPPERLAVGGYLLAFWHLAISARVRSPLDDSVDTALCALGNACHTVNPFLELWTSERCPAAANQLAQFVLLNYDDILHPGRLYNSFWTGCEEQMHEVMAWLASPTTHEFMRCQMDDLEPHLTHVVALLASIPPPR